MGLGGGGGGEFGGGGAPSPYFIEKNEKKQSLMLEAINKTWFEQNRCYPPPVTFIFHFFLKQPGRRNENTKLANHLLRG